MIEVYAKLWSFIVWQEIDGDIYDHIYEFSCQGPILLTWFNFNPTMDK